MELNRKESAVLAFVAEAGRPVKIREISNACFGDTSPEKGDSFVRNSLRKLRDELGVVEKVDHGTYAATGVALTQGAPIVDMAKLAEVQNLIRSAVYKTAGSVMSPEEVDDAVQTINEKLVAKQMARFNQDKAKLSTFVYSVARSTAIDILKRRPRVQMVELSDAEPSTGEDVLAMLIKKEQVDAVRKAISMLDSDDQEFAAAYFGDEFKIEEFAAAHGIRPESVYARKCRLQDKLRKLIRENTDLL